MTDNLYLILHKVRGEPAFDVAQRHEMQIKDDGTTETIWIIPTSGHRAHPWWSMEMKFVSESIDPVVGIFGCMREPPSTDNPKWASFPDHYACNEPSRPAPPIRRQPATKTEDFLI